MKTKLIIIVLEAILTNFCMLYTFIRIRGKKEISKKKAIFIFILNIITSFIYATLYRNYMQLNHILFSLICNTCFVLMVAIYIKEIDYSFAIVMLLTICISFFSLFISSIILYFVTIGKTFSLIRSTIFEYIIIEIAGVLCIHLFFNIKRFKNGFSFFKEKKFHENIRIMNFFVIFLVTILMIFAINENHFINRIMFCVISAGMIAITLLIRRAITKQYKSNMKNRTIESLKKQIAEKDSQIVELKSELGKALKINHKYNHRISAMERALSKIKFGEEFANENGELTELVKQLSKEYRNEVETLEDIAKTGVNGIDNLIEHMNNQAKKSNIKFCVEIKYDISEIIDKFIKQGKLETLLADHINDAIIAINHSNNNVKEIMVEFNKDNDIYEIKFYDTGIEFDIDTLLKLGKEQVTTHKDSGGSGIGFVTTFETLHGCKGSLIIEEYEPNQCKYSKSVIIRFDNKNMYKVRSYRQDEISKLENGALIIEKIQL